MNKLITVIAVFALIGNFNAQKSSKELKGDKQFEKYSFSKAIDIYAAVEDLSEEGQKNLAESYMYTQQFDKSIEMYEGFINASGTTGEDYFNYASVLRLQGRYDESDTWMKKFLTVAPEDSRAKNYVENAEEFSKISKDEGRFKITTLDINSDQQDFCPAYLGEEKIVFASSRQGVKSIKRFYNWNNLPFLDLYVADNESPQMTNPVQFNKKQNSSMHEGPASFNMAGDFMAFTRNNYEGKSEDGIIKLKIFFATKNDDGSWGDPVEFEHNSNEYSVGHPCISQDGKTMYFASDMPGGQGGVDIYKVTSFGGQWGKPENLGAAVNTAGNEVFPFFQDDEEMLFFASNGHLGLGGLDIFVSPATEDGKFKKVLNAGVPMNTRFDDFGLIIDERMRQGYFSSNREGGKGDDDIYAFEMLKPFSFDKKIKGFSKDEKGAIVAGVTLELYGADGELIESVNTDSEGKFEFSVEPELDFVIKAKKEGYFDGSSKTSSDVEEDVVNVDVKVEKDPGLALYTLITDAKTGEPLSGVTLKIIDNFTNSEFQNLTTPGSGDALKGISDKKVGDNISFNISMTKEGYFPKSLTFNHKISGPGNINVHEILEGGLTMDHEVKDLSEMIELKPINFDMAKYKIRPDAALELDKIVLIMNKYPKMIVELGAHTDCVGSRKYNKSLSDKRAKSSANYIKERISDPERITGKGYGEDRLAVEKCACEGRVKADCTEEEHAQNRRTEFRVVSIGQEGVEVKNNGNGAFD